MIIYLNSHPQTLSYSLAMVTLSLLNHLFVSSLPNKLRPLSETALSRYLLSLKGWTDNYAQPEHNSALVTVWVSRSEPGPRGWPHGVVSIPRRASARLQSLHSGHPAGQTQNRHTEPASGESASVQKTPLAGLLTFRDASASVNPSWLQCSPFLPPTTAVPGAAPIRSEPPRQVPDHHVGPGPGGILRPQPRTSR